MTKKIKPQTKPTRVAPAPKKELLTKTEYQVSLEKGSENKDKTTRFEEFVTPAYIAKYIYAFEANRFDKYIISQVVPKEDVKTFKSWLEDINNRMYDYENDKTSQTLVKKPLSSTLLKQGEDGEVLFSVQFDKYKKTNGVVDKDKVNKPPIVVDSRVSPLSSACKLKAGSKLIVGVLVYSSLDGQGRAGAVFRLKVVQVINLIQYEESGEQSLLEAVEDGYIAPPLEGVVQLPLGSVQSVAPSDDVPLLWEDDDDEGVNSLI